MAVGETKYKNGNNGIVILCCETREDLETLKVTAQTKLDENFKITESPQMKPPR